MCRNTRQRRIHITFLFFPLDGKAHPSDRQHHAQDNRDQHKPRPSVAGRIFILVGHAQEGSSRL